MNWNSLTILGAVALFAVLPGSAAAQTVLSDFSGLAGQSPAFLDSWKAGANDQYVQRSGYVSIEPVNGGNPRSDGRFLVTTALDLNAFTSLQVTAREVTGNLTGLITILFENSGGAVREYTFAATAFSGGSFFTASVSLATPSASDNNFEPTAVTAWGIEGDKSQAVRDFRFEFDHVQLTPVPEPGAWALLLFGAGACWLRGRFARN